ncbi:MAG: hypothetical protein ACRCXX_07220 [Cetobacterium sp.]|uniref:hypothetical protein n=1 Tax=Cetobacterium sp. TaxID=2071632 RepID=UPI003F3C8EF9
MDRLEVLMATLKKEMKAKKITALKMSNDLGISNKTISETLSLKHASVKNIKKIIKYIDSN